MSTNFKKLLPLLNRIVVRKVEPETKTKSGIILQKPDSLNYGVVLEAGPGAYDSNGKVVPMNVKVGDTVLLPEFGGNKVKLGEQELLIYKDTDIIAKLEAWSLHMDIICRIFCYYNQQYRYSICIRCFNLIR